MRKNGQEYKEFLRGIENLSDEGRVYIKNLTEAMFLYENSLVSSGVARQPDEAKTLPDTAELESTD
jgi:hypothetical protein